MSISWRSINLAFTAAAMALAALVPWHPSQPIRCSAALVLGTLLLWVSEIAPLGVIALGIPIAASALGLTTWREALLAWGDPVVFLFLGAFLLARALDKHGAFDPLIRSRRVQAASGSAVMLILGVLLVSGALSTVQNNTAVAAMLLPAALALARRSAAPAGVLLALSYGATLGGMATPVGTAPNFLGFAEMKRVGADVGFLSWMAVGVPVWLGTTLVAWATLAVSARFFRSAAVEPSSGWFEPFVVTDVGPEPAWADGGRRWNEDAAARRWTWAAVIGTASIWLTADLFVNVLALPGETAAAIKRYLPESLIPIAAALLLFIVRTGPQRRPVLDRHDFQALDWDTLFLIAGGLCLGRVLESTGTARAVADWVAGLQVSEMVLMLALGGVTVLLSELTSNTATAALMVPIATALAGPMNVSPAKAIYLVALSASLGFVLPVSTPPNAIVYGTRLIPLRQMALCGVVIDGLSLVWVVVCVRLLA
ncbi:Sodium-dependent dicarboxylate transporter SdcS [Phycisphaerae bacterium RAS1]|nr:Sodium-dependent dicarboxylate transporter SdcS [Phycisphaerae bacterium RAS1]